MFQTIGLSFCFNQRFILNFQFDFSSIALSRVGLRDLGITHLLNMAQGKSNYHVNANHVMYRKVNIEYLGMEATDQMNFDLSVYFEKGADFIEKGLSSGGNYD